MYEETGYEAIAFTVLGQPIYGFRLSRRSQKKYFFFFGSLHWAWVGFFRAGMVFVCMWLLTTTALF